MSLDERTLEWLNGKSGADYPAPCVRTGRRGLFTMFYCLTCPCDYNRAVSLEFCPLASDYRDAAEFEARVAAKLATYEYTDPCNGKTRCPYAGKGWSCRRCNLKHARLAVEEEMAME